MPLLALVVTSIAAVSYRYPYRSIEQKIHGLAHILPDFLTRRADEATMATKQPLKTTFDVERVIRPVYTGGSVAIDNKAQILATTLGEDAILTSPSNGKHLAQIEGVSDAPRVCKIE